MDYLFLGMVCLMPCGFRGERTAEFVRITVVYCKNLKAGRSNCESKSFCLTSFYKKNLIDNQLKNL